MEVITLLVVTCGFGYGMWKSMKAAFLPPELPKLKRNLQGVRIGVACFESNGSVHDLEAEVMNAILESKGRCVTTNRKRVQSLMKGLDVADGGGKLVDADLLIAATVIESQQSTGKRLGKTDVQYTDEFKAWVRSHYPEHCDYSGRPYKEQAAIGNKYRQATGKMPAEPTPMEQVVEIRVDFRCFSSNGEVVGAGVLTQGQSSDPTLRLCRENVIRFLARELVNRIHVSSVQGGYEIWCGSRDAAIQVRTMSSTNGSTHGQLMLPPGE